MPLYQPTIPTRYTAPLLAILADMGGTVLERVLQTAGMAAAELQDDSAPLPMASFEALLAAITHHTGREDIGFDLGLQITSRHHGVLFAALVRCATLEAMLQTLARYFQLITPTFQLRYRRLARHGEFSWRPAAPMSPLALRAMEEIFAVTVQVQFGAALTLPQPYDVYLAMPAPAHAARYRTLAPGRFHFGHFELPEVRVVVSPELLHTPLRWPDGAAAPVTAADLAGLQRGMPRTPHWSAWVAMMLREADGCQPSREQLAALLNVSPRTLTRYLAAEGQTLREIALAVRFQRACALLSGSRLAITEIAQRLGYGDSANFSHAFRSASGVSPRTYRQERG